MPRYDNILQTVGNTPVVRLSKFAPELSDRGVELYVKVESHNPMGSVKDRLALGIIEDAERRGLLSPGQTVIEATSGNTGIGLAMVCAHRGYPLVVVMAENFSIERRKMMRFLGARVVLTPAADKGTGMLEKARELAEEHGWFLCRQFENEANADIHSATTAREILSDFDDVGLDYFVSGFGTGGTLKGIARTLKAESPGTRIVACEPDNSPMVGSGIAQPRRRDGSPDGSHPGFRPHLMQGWAPDFIPKLTEDAVGAGLVDEVLPVAGQDALELSRALARQEGIFVGISAGATLAGALAVGRRAPRGSRILCMLPDTGERYQSTPLFADIDVDMNDEEQTIARSTPNYRFDVPDGPTDGATDGPTDAAGGGALSAEPGAMAYVERVLADPARPVVLFALEWCEFCWSIRKLFDAAGIAYRSVDLDSVALQEGDLGGRIRAELLRRTGMRTIPQVFVGGAFIGGCSETFDAFSDGSLQQAMRAAGTSPSRGSADVDPNRLLPGWLARRQA
ncbi:MAG: cysteine synthase [Myxococcales bacterium]|nr:cysteine synthase [Myxococcales bacterium]